ncbi:hypothetical protein ACXYMT_00990 [Salinimicrobium sp. CAU 1759]
MTLKKKKCSIYPFSGSKITDLLKPWKLFRELIKNKIGACFIEGFFKPKSIRKNRVLIGLKIRTFRENKLIITAFEL